MAQVAETQKLLGPAVHAAPVLDSFALSHSLCDWQQQTDRKLQRRAKPRRSVQGLRQLAGTALAVGGGGAVALGGAVLRLLQGDCRGEQACVVFFWGE